MGPILGSFVIINFKYKKTIGCCWCALLLLLTYYFPNNLHSFMSAVFCECSTPCSSYIFGKNRTIVGARILQDGELNTRDQELLESLITKFKLQAQSPVRCFGCILGASAVIPLCLVCLPIPMLMSCCMNELPNRDFQVAREGNPRVTSCTCCYYISSFELQHEMTAHRISEVAQRNSEIILGKVGGTTTSPIIR